MDELAMHLVLFNAIVIVGGTYSAVPLPPQILFLQITNELTNINELTNTNDLNKTNEPNKTNDLINTDSLSNTDYHGQTNNTFGRRRAKHGSRPLSVHGSATRM